jgi:hypothetical protein
VERLPPSSNLFLARLQNVQYTIPNTTTPTQQKIVNVLMKPSGLVDEEEVCSTSTAAISVTRLWSNPLDVWLDSDIILTE